MRTDFYYDSCGAGRIHACSWIPDKTPIAVVQIVHGIAEHVERYQVFADYLNQQGVLVVAEDHMGHGASIGNDGIQGYFQGGWFAVVEDTYTLVRRTVEAYPGIPYFLFGHSMGSFIARSILAKYPDSGIAGCVICGTAWQPAPILTAGIQISRLICKTYGEKKPGKVLEKMIFGGYNQRVEHPRSAYDWLSRDGKIVDAYIQDPLCGFTATAGLLRDMLLGIAYIQEPKVLRQMCRNTPIFFVAGKDDPVGAYGKGVQKTAQVFRDVGMQDVTLRLYPLCRHEILNEINKTEVYANVWTWISKYLPGR